MIARARGVAARKDGPSPTCHPAGPAPALPSANHLSPPGLRPNSRPAALVALLSTFLFLFEPDGHGDVPAITALGGIPADAVKGSAAGAFLQVLFPWTGNPKRSPEFAVAGYHV